MFFKDIKPNYPVYIFDKQTLEYIQGKVTSVSLPRLQQLYNNGVPSLNSGITPNTSMVVDVTIDAGGRSATYSIPENSSITYAGNLVLSTECDGVVKEIEATHNLAEQALSMVERQKEIKEKTAALLVELNPVYKEKKNTEERFNKIENSVSEMKNMLSSFIREFKN